MSQVNYYSTDLGIVVQDNVSIRLKSTFTKRILTEEEFNNSNPVKIKTNQYLEKLNTWFKNAKHEWVYDGTEFKKLDNFELKPGGSCVVTNYDLNKDIPRHENIIPGVIGSGFIVMYHGRLYYTFISGNYYPQMQLIDFSKRELTSKWTNIKNLAPVFNKNKKQII